MFYKYKTFTIALVFQIKYDHYSNYYSLIKFVWNISSLAFGWGCSLLRVPEMCKCKKKRNQNPIHMHKMSKMVKMCTKFIQTIANLFISRIGWMLQKS